MEENGPQHVVLVLEGIAQNEGGDEGYQTQIHNQQEPKAVREKGITGIEAIMKEDGNIRNPLGMGEAVDDADVEILNEVEQEIADDVGQEGSTDGDEGMEEELLAVRGGQGQLLDARLLGEQVMEGVTGQNGQGEEEAAAHPGAQTGAGNAGQGPLGVVRDAKHPDGLQYERQQGHTHGEEEAEGQLEVLRAVDGEVPSRYIEETSCIHNFYFYYNH